MNTKCFLILFTLYFTSFASMSMIGFDTQTKLNVQHLTCLQSKYYLQQTYIQLYNDGTIVSSVDENLLRQVFVEPHAIIILLPTDTHSSAWAIEKWKSHILNRQYKSLWITWTYGGGYKIDCLGVWNIFLALQRITNKMGIFMSEQRWNDNEYLNIGYCKNLNKFSLFAQDLAQFKPFNGWNNYEQKIQLIVRNICEIDQISLVSEKNNI